MEKPIKDIKAEPFHSSYEFVDIEIKQESEVKIEEIDESIFLQGCTNSSKAIADSNIDQSTEDITIYDQIIKEEPVFYDATENQILSYEEEEEKSKSIEYFEHNLSLKLIDSEKAVEEKNFECYICRCETVNIGLLKWHLQERHSQEPLVKSQQSMKKKSSETLKQTKLKKQCTNEHQTQTFHQQQNFDEQDHRLQNQIADIDLKCSYCHRKFATKQRVKKHERIHTNTQPFKCPTCFKGYNDKNNLETHLRIHTGEKPYSCESCGIKFRSWIQLYHHRKAHEKGKILPEPNTRRTKILENVETKDFPRFRFFECYLCGFRGHIRQVYVHMAEEHTGRNLHQCKICLKKFARKYSLSKHLTTHTNSEQCECKICGKMLTSNKGLKLHLQTHTGEYIHECKYCHKKYSTIKILRNHIRTHTGLKPHECEYCKRGFVRRADMVRHTLIHTGERPYKCDICKSTFSRNHLLTDHKRNIHKIFHQL